MGQDAHDQIVMPFPSDPGGLSFGAFMGEATGLIAADGAGVVSEDA